MTMRQGHEIRHFRTLTLDLCCKAVEVGEIRQRLTKGEFSVIELLTRRPGVLFSRQQLMDAIYGDNAGYYSDRSADSHIKRIRKQGVPGIICHYGLGYSWEDRVIVQRGRSASSIREKAIIMPKRCSHCGAPISREA